MSLKRLPPVRLLVLLLVASGLAALGFASRPTVSAASHTILATATATPKPTAGGLTGRPNPGGRTAPRPVLEPPVTGGAAVPEIPLTGFGGTAKSGATLPATGGAAGDSSSPLLPLTLGGLALIAVGRMMRRYIRS